jgi:hypothetical protein
MGGSRAGAVEDSEEEEVGVGEGEAVPPATLQSLDVDPRFLEYDSDTHAEMLALGLQMRKHTTAKALIDARWVKWGGAVSVHSIHHRTQLTTLFIRT